MTERRTVRVSAAEGALLLGVFLIVATVTGSGAAVLGRARRAALARQDLRVLLDAGRRFYADNRTWPVPRSEYGDRRYGREVSNAEVLNALRAVEGPGNPGHSVNPKRMVYFEGTPYRRGASGLDPRGELLDPWGRPYQIVVDADLDNACDIASSIYGRRAGEGMVAWSCGPDGISDTADDIVSWESKP